MDRSTFKIVADPSTFVGNSRYLVTGKISMHVSDHWFPEKEWDDFPIIIVGNWINEYIDFINNESEKCTFYFMDGPYEAILEKQTTETLLVRCIRRGSSDPGIQTTTTFQTLKRSLIATATECLAKASSAKWSNPDVARLQKGFKELNSMTVP